MFRDKEGNLYIHPYGLLVSVLVAISCQLVLASFVFRLLSTFAVVLKIAIVISAVMWFYRGEYLIAILSVVSASQFVFFAYHGEDFIVFWSEYIAAANSWTGFMEIIVVIVVFWIYLFAFYLNIKFYCKLNIGKTRIKSGGEISSHIIYGSIGWGLNIVLIIVQSILKI